MAMSPLEIKNLFKMNYNVLSLALELEKQEHPETYGAVARLAERVRRGFVDSTGTAEDFPEFPK